jgi:hypothetical protein
VEPKATNGAAPSRDRFNVWLNKVQKEFRVRSEVIDRPPPRFSGALTRHEIGRMTLIDVSGTAYAASHAREGSPNTVNVLLAMRGSTHMVQSGFDIVLNPGDYCILDSSAPSVTTIPAPFQNVVALFPLSDVNTILPTGSGRSARSSMAVRARVRCSST